MTNAAEGLPAFALEPGDVALVVADLHWDSAGEVHDASGLDASADHLERLVTSTGATALFVLGDLLTMRERDPAFARRSVERLAATGVERLVLLPGNHDRDLSRLLGSGRNAGGRWRVVDATWCVLLVGEGPPAYLTHDAGGGHFTDPSNVHAYLGELRDLADVRGAPAGSWLLAGHAHEPFALPSRRTAAVGAFWASMGHPHAQIRAAGDGGDGTAKLLLFQGDGRGREFALS
ncbi:MAG: hypothetical protein Kow0069_25540 [Promethearchaeota archaeon]